MLDLPEPPAALTAAGCARVYSTVAWSCEQVFEVAAGWVESAAAAETKVSLSVAARLFGWHAAQWRSLIPESVLLEDDRRAAPATAAREALAELALVEPGFRVNSLRVVAGKMRNEVDLLTACLSPISEGAAIRLATFLRADLDRLSGPLEG